MPMKRIILGKVIVEEPYALDVRVLYCFSAVFKNREHKKPLSIMDWFTPHFGILRSLGKNLKQKMKSTEQ
jgi:hypothetical protein